MISIAEALQRVRKNTPKTEQIIKNSVQDAIGFVVAKDVVSPVSMPPFRQSAMDGYALHLHDENNYTLKGEVKAGDGEEVVLNKGEAIRIFTGAKVPASANAIAIQEKVTRKEGTISLVTPVKEGANIRPLGEQVTRGAIALPKNTLLNAAGLGYLASLGITEVEVYKKPSIAIVVTGNELIPPGTPLPPGKIYESNSSMLEGLLKSLGYNTLEKYVVPDHYERTVDTLKMAISMNDFVIISGGISVGDYDYVGKALEEIGLTEHFYKVFQKPGKPLYYGSFDGKQIYGLPGNPAATLTCFYKYVLMGLELFSGNDTFQLQRTMAKAKEAFEAKGDRPQFLKAVYSDGVVEILEGQNSSMLHTFSLANALVFKPETTSKINANDLVEVLLLP